MKDQLEFIKSFNGRILEATKQLVSKLSPSDNPPATCEYWLSKLLKAPQYISGWKGSAARASAAHVLTLARAYHPDINIEQIAQGRQATHTDGTEFSLVEYSDI